MSVLPDWPAGAPESNTFFLRSILRQPAFLVPVFVALSLLVFDGLTLFRAHADWRSQASFWLVVIPAAILWKPLYGAYALHSRINELYLAGKIPADVPPDSPLNEVLRVAEVGIAWSLQYAYIAIFCWIVLLALRIRHGQ